MTTATAPPRTARQARNPAASARRVLNLARYEVLLLVRNKVMLFNALLVAPLMVFVILSLIDVPLATADVIMMTALWAAMFVVYLNLTAIFVSRREDRVFARMETGEASKWEALCAAAIPSSAIMVLQLLGAGVLGAYVFGGTVLAEPVLAPIGLLLTIVIFAALAAATTAITKTVEAAQLTTMPVLIAASLTSGMTLPLGFLPEIVQTIAAATPLNALAALVLPGFEIADLPIGPLGVLLIWTVLSIALARRYTTFAARR